MTRRVLRRAARVIAVSQFTKSEIEKLLDLPDDRLKLCTTPSTNVSCMVMPPMRTVN